MEALIAKGDVLGPPGKKRKLSHKDSSKYASNKSSTSTGSDGTVKSITVHTKLPKSFRSIDSKGTENAPKHTHIANKKLRNELTRTSAHIARSKALLADADLLLEHDAGKIEVENEMERTWRLDQGEITQSTGLEAAKGRQEWKLDGGPYRIRYTRNGRHIAVVGKKGHAATFDWQNGTLHSELQLQETCRDITFLHDHSFYAVAQKKYAFIYDRDGVEVHCLKAHIEPTRLEFLPYHWLLASVGNAGYLKYQDTSTGQLLQAHRTKLGSTLSMAQNPHTAVLYLGHNNGSVTLWTPNLPHPAVQVQAHLGGVVSLGVDSSSMGRYMATCGRDSTVKIWDCRNWKGVVREWNLRGAGGNGELEWSQRGMLSVAFGGTINIYSQPALTTPHNFSSPPPLYLTHPIPARPLTSLRFAPFQDVLTIGYANGVSSILVPGSGEPNFDSAEADPYENSKARREREVKGLLDKIPADMITLDPSSVGSMAPESNLVTAVEMTVKGTDSRGGMPFARLPRSERLKVQGKYDETEVVDSADENDGGEAEVDEGQKASKKEEKEKKKMRGRNKSLKRYLRKQRKNVIDPTAVALRKKLEKQRALLRAANEAAKMKETGSEPSRPSALDRFKRTS